MKDEENINFEMMPDFGKILSNKGNLPPEELEEYEDKYDSLYDELKDKCNPKNFLHPYDFDKFKIANELYSQLLLWDENPDKSLLSFRNRCINNLGIHISTKKLYDYLFSIVNPELYIVDDDYDAAKVARAGELYHKLLQSKNDIRALEHLETEIHCFIEEFTDEEIPNTDTNDVPDEVYDFEEYYFINFSADDYLEKYPDGIYSEEANYFLKNEMEDYLREYPNGRYAYKTKPVR